MRAYQIITLDAQQLNLIEQFIYFIDTDTINVNKYVHTYKTNNVSIDIDNKKMYYVCCTSILITK